MQELGVDSHVACEHTDNLGEFRVENIHCLDDAPLPARIWDKGWRKLGLRRHLHHLVEAGMRTGCQIVHSHFGHFGWANLGAIRRLKCKHVVTFYGLDVNQLPIQNPAWRKRYLRLFAEADLVLCEGSFMANSVEQLGCDADKIRVQHLGVDVENIRVQARHWRPGEPLCVLIAASFREKKGIPYAIDALGIVSREVPLRLTIIGDAGQGEEDRREKVEILAALERNKLTDRTRMLGYQSHQVLLKEGYDHHLFLQPSVTARSGDTEGGAPVAIIEMMATGMPIVATTHCDIPEVVGSAGAHLLAPERDAEKLATCIRSLLDNPEDWSRLARLGREHVEREYHVRRQTESLIDHYNSLNLGI